MRFAIRALATLSVILGGAWHSAQATAYDAKPKLVVILVIDQFRGDYLDRYRADFKTPNGFNLFLKKGAYFPDCYFDYANTMTAPGHATIGTGAYTDGHNIALNDWWDLQRSAGHMISSVEDERYTTVGLPDSSPTGASPRNELASTLGDEVVLSTGGKAKLFGVSLKDRAAILTSGHASRGAFWIDHATGRFISSTFWYKELPAWAAEFNSNGEVARIRRETGITKGDFYNEVGKTPASVDYQLDFAKALIAGENLGRNDATDLLTISISSTDILGHDVGPDAPQQRALLAAIDVSLNGFFNWLDHHVDGGLPNVWVALTGDHGVAPSPSIAAKEGMPAGSFSYTKLLAELNSELNSRFTPGDSQNYILGGELPYLQLNERAFELTKLKESEAEDLVAQMLSAALDKTQVEILQREAVRGAQTPASVRHVYTKMQIEAGHVPDTQQGHLILHSFTTNGGWWVMMTPGMYQMTGHEEEGTTHFTPYSYDRHVPLAFFGSAFVSGTYLERTAPVDIAATFAALLRVNQPSASVGRVVVEALRPEANANGPERK